ncbi:RsiV family protein [Paenibacillus rhizoplanae]
MLELSGYHFPFGAAHGMPTRIYEHINLRTGKFYTLSDLFKPGSKYVQKLSDIVGKQIANDPQYSYVFPDTYKGITADQPFYVDAQALYLYFAPYEIAPYSAGFPTFRIPYAEIMGLISTEGEFWQSFSLK